MLLLLCAAAFKRYVVVVHIHTGEGSISVIKSLSNALLMDHFCLAKEKLKNMGFTSRTILYVNRATDGTVSLWGDLLGSI